METLCFMPNQLNSNFMKTILVPTDFSKNASYALNYAIELAKQENAKLILLHAYHIDYTNSYVPANLIEKEIQEAEQKSNAHLKTLTTKVTHAGNIKCEYISTQDFAVDAILSTIKEKNIDLVVMGTKGASGLTEVIFGSNTAKVIEKATCPVIAVPENALFKTIKKITYASDYHNSDMEALKKVLELAKPFKAQLNVLHITEKKHLTGDEKQKMQKFMDEVQKKIKYNNLSFQVLHGEDIEQKLEEYLEDESTDLLVMSTHHRNLLDKLFNTSITKKLAFHTKVPLMAFHYKKKESLIIY